MTATKRRRFGSVFRRKRADGTSYAGYYVRYTDAWGRRHQEYGGANKSTAEAYLRKKGAARDVAQITGQRPVERVSLESVRERIVGHWQATLRPSTVVGRKGFVRTAAEHFGKTPLVSITTGDVQQFLDGLGRRKNLKPGTVRHHAAVLSSAFEYAVQIGAAARNPVKGVKLPKAQRKERPYLTDEQRRHIYAHMPKEIRTCVILMGDAGLRRNEAVYLTWDAVTPGFDFLTVTHSKNHKTRVLPLTARAATALREQWKRRGAAQHRGRTRAFDFKPSTLNKLFREGADAAGFPTLTPHVLRHAFASGLVRSGTDLPTVARLLGHADIQMAAHYGQWAPENAAQLAIRAFEKANAPATTPRESRAR